MAPKKRTRRVSLPRPRRTSSRAELVIVMHPHELDALIDRARTRSMSLTRYVEALLASDAEDVPTSDPRQLSLVERLDADRAERHKEREPRPEPLGCHLCGEPATATLRARPFCSSCLPTEPVPADVARLLGL